MKRATLLLSTIALMVLILGSSATMGAAQTTVESTTGATVSSEGPSPTSAPNSEMDPIDKFAEPLFKMVTSNQTMPTDINQLLQSIPELLVSIPGVGHMDVSKLPPWMVEHVLRGGQLPGVRKETLDAIVKQYMQRVYVAALHELGREPAPREGLPSLPKGVDPKSYLRPVAELPQRFVTSVLQGHPLPHLTKEQTQVIKDYYVRDMPVLAKMFDGAESADVTKIFTPKVLAMIKLMPPGFDYTQLPPDVLKSVMDGEVPDLSQLPPELQNHLKKNLDHVFNALSSSPEVSIDEILSKLPTFETSSQPTYSPYDINSVDSSLVEPKINAESKDLNAEAIHFYGLVSLGVIALLTATCIIVALYRLRCAKIKGEKTRQEGSSEHSHEEDAFAV